MIRYTLKLYVNQILTTQRKVNVSEIKTVIKALKLKYGLKNHNYEIYIYTSSKMNS